MQPDGSVQALTLIVFIGSVFSPYYAWARRRLGDDGAPAQAHCAINVSLYQRAPGDGGFSRLWTMTERGQETLARDGLHLSIGPSSLQWLPDGSLQIDLDEWTVPFPQRVRGRITVRPGAMPGWAFALDPGGLHHWQPIAPASRVEVDLASPRRRWQGEAYLDANHGSRPLARDFLSWQWQRTTRHDGRTTLLYDVVPRCGASEALALSIDTDGRLSVQPPPPRQPLPRSGWRVERHTLGLAPPQLLATLESGPFYCRSLLREGDSGALAMHESLSLQRFDQHWVQALLPFRMPRRRGGSLAVQAARSR
ncbi:carotenoid 1,2-hydratase [Roseateles terrae]|uniref:Carotenoid 1,2-hydratase n=1 Tax=Roseateles terrae TaxID=431060 RepID=A0ABR6GUH6_9BURK|nr:carotenoid 1,2-hydratase [Roseateles terrae]